MTFIDNLGIELDALILVTAAVFYTGFWVLWSFTRGSREEALRHLRGGAFVMGLLGSFLLLLGIWGEFVWPLPASYNLLFYDPTVMIGLLLVGFAVLVAFRLPTHFIGLVGVVSGSGVIYYGARAYRLGLTLEPLEMFAMFAAFGLLAIVAWPATWFVDREVTGAVPGGGASTAATGSGHLSNPWKVALLLFLAMAVLAGVAAILMGFNTVWDHLAAAP